ncbi:MAG: hypothetical protein WA715_26755 [Candidatus Acidiferrum sp.]|jgi:hypothetical protein
MPWPVLDGAGACAETTKFARSFQDDYGDFWPGVKPSVDERIAPHRLMKLENEGIVLYVR